MKERLISFYYQFGLSQGVLQEDIDSFFSSAKSQPPKKFVILSKRILKRVNELVFLGKKIDDYILEIPELWSHN